MMYAFSHEKIRTKSEFNKEFNGAAIIDDQGNEVPITEAMVQHALKAMEGNWDLWQSPFAITPHKPEKNH